MNASSPASHKLFLRLFGAHFRKTLPGPLLLALILLASQVASAATYTVTNTLDSGVGSLRDALTNVNSGLGGDTVVFSDVTGTITLSIPLIISQSVAVNGPGANLLTISGNDAVQVFNVATGKAFSISGLTIAHGHSSTGGGGIFVGVSATLTVNNCVFSNNAASNGASSVGGAISNTSVNLLTVNNSTFVNNKALTGPGILVGGAIYTAGTAEVDNSTFFGNSTPGNGGAIGGSIRLVTVKNSTVVGNSAGGVGGIFGPSMTVSNSIISGNTGSSDCSHCIATNNLVGAGTAALGPLQNNGGPTPTMMPLSTGTGIIGAGLSSTLATDQRGFVRPTSGASDLGAVQTYNLVVTTLADVTNGGTTCTAGDPCSLRDALTLADSHGSGDIIPLDGLHGTIALTSPLPAITTNINISGPGANLLTISGGNAYPVFQISNSGEANISGVTIANGNSGTPGGAGITNLGALLTLSNCELNNNHAAGQDGGGFFNSGSSTATVTNCTFSGNSSDSGGAINNNGYLAVTNSTFFGNTAQSDFGGGIFNQRLATITSSTITGNTAASQGGGIENIGTITVTNSVVAGNTEAGTPNDDCSSCGTQSASNLLSTAGTPVTAAQAMLAPLAYYGLNQTVRTMLPLPGSPVVQAGDPTLLPSDLSTDERLLPRTISGKLDLGAVEANYTSIQFVRQPSNTTVNQIMSPVVTMSVTESGTTAANITLPVTFAGSGALHGTVTATTQAPSIPGDPALASFAGQSGDTVGTGDTLASSVTVTPAGVTPAQTLTATSDPFDIIGLPISEPTVTVGPATSTYGQPVTVTVTVPTVGGTPPTGTVTIYVNGNPVGTGTLTSNGAVVVTLPGGTLPTGTDTITVGYSGDSHYGNSTSGPATATVTGAAALDFSLTRTSALTQTVISGAAATIAVQVAPTNGAYPGVVSFTATGLPLGSTATFSPSTVTADGGPAPVKLSVQTASLLTMNRLGSDVPSIALGLLLLPFLGTKRKRLLKGSGAAGQYIFMMLVLLVGAVGMAGLTGCGKGNGFFGHAPKTYDITITATSGTIQHSVNATLNVQ